MSSFQTGTKDDTQTGKNEAKPADDYWNWKAVFSYEIKQKTKIYRDYKKKGNSHIDLFSLTADPDLFSKLN